MTGARDEGQETRADGPARGLSTRAPGRRQVKGSNAMSLSEVERFAADLKSNEALRADAVKARTDKSQAAPLAQAAAFAASKGYAFTADEAKEYVKAAAKAAGKQLTDAELDGVTGGYLDVPFAFLSENSINIDPGR
jgi:hypothetical protein